MKLRDTAICTGSEVSDGLRRWFPAHLATLKKRAGVVMATRKEARDEQREHKSGQRASGRWCIGAKLSLLRDYAPVLWHFTFRRDIVYPTLFKSQTTCTSHTVDSPGLNAKGSRGVSIAQDWRM